MRALEKSNATTSTLSTLLVPVLGVALAVGLTACGDDSPLEPEEPEEPSSTVVWDHGFELGTAGWITDDMSGAAGWCGDITHHGQSAGPVSSSQGFGYAVVEHGACNEYWVDAGFPSSGPYGPFGGYSGVWPAAGFVTEIDVYLDPSWQAGPEGSVLTLAVSFMTLDEQPPGNFRYLFVPVTKSNGDLTVTGNAVAEAGWYTFRHTFSGDGGNLAVELELVRDGETVFSQPVSSTGLSGEDVSSFTSTDVGTGYHWFVAIREGLGVPIDHQRLLYPEQ